MRIFITFQVVLGYIENRLFSYLSYIFKIIF
jgi:hypothetical protein